jgi:hypothetical protein
MEWVSDDILQSSFSMRLRLVGITALLGHYLPLPHSLLRLLSHVPALYFSNLLFGCAVQKLSTLYDYV